MRGLVEIDRKSGQVESKLSQVEDGATISELSEQQLQEIGQCLTNILQDVNSYMRSNNNEMGDLEKATLKLDEHHYVNIVVSHDTIKASVGEI